MEECIMDTNGNRHENDGFAWPSGFVPAVDLGATKWLQDPTRWLPWHAGSSIDRVVAPKGFTHYLRVNHPAWLRNTPLSVSPDELFDLHDRPVRWSEVGQWAQIDPKHCLSFGDLIPSDRQLGADVPFTDPPCGLTAEVITVLTRVLGGLTSTPTQIWMAFWEGLGVWNNSSWLVLPTGQSERRVGQDRIQSLPRWAPPGWEATGRRYWLAMGSLDTVIDLSRTPLKIEPNFWWPQDRAWFLSQDVDMDFTVIGTNSDGANRLHRESALEIVTIEA